MAGFFKYFFILLFIIFQFGAETFAQQKPAWVLQQPINSDYFIGIASANKKESDFEKAAKNRALESLASEISIKLVSQTMLNTSEVKQKVKQQFVRNIQTETAKELEGYELVEIWQDEKYYWVFYRLNKSDYFLKKRIKVEQGIHQAEFYKAEAEKAIQNNDAFQYITQLFLAAKEVQTYTSFEYDSELRKRSNELYTDCNSKLSSGLNSLQVNSKSFEGGTLDPVNKQLVFTVTVSINNKFYPISNIGLNFIFNSGEMTEPKAVSGNDGVFRNQVRALKQSESSFTLKVQPDFQETFKTHILQNNFIALSLSNTLQDAKIFNFDFSKKQVIVYIETKEQSMGKPLQPKILESALKELCLQKGIILSDKETDAQYILKVNSSSSNMGESFDMNVVANNTEIQLLEGKGKKLLYNKQLLNVKGLKKGLSAANLDSYSRTIRKINEEVQDDLWQLMGLNDVSKSEY